MTAFTEITSSSHLKIHQEALPTSTLLLLYFYTPWTKFCDDLKLGLVSMASQHPINTISIVGIDGKELVDVAKEYGVRKAPCVVLWRDGKVLEATQGFDLDAIHAAVGRCTGISTKLVEETEPVELSPALTKRLEELVISAPVMLFMKGVPEAPRCRFSRRIVGLLREKDIPFESFDILADEEVRQGLKLWGDWPTYPQLWLDGKLIGGLEIVRELFDSGSDSEARDEKTVARLQVLREDMKEKEGLLSSPTDGENVSNRCLTMTAL